MSIGSFEVFFFTVGFLVPGFIWSVVLSVFVPRRATSGQLRFLEFLTLSCLNHGLWSWALFLIVQTGFMDAHPVWAALCLCGIIFVSPVGLGVATGFLQQKEIVRSFLRALAVRTIHPTPCAWDWYFMRERPSWVLVRLNDGTQVFGLFHEKSFAASDPQQRDIYLEAQFRLLDSGEWAPVEESDGVLIMAGQISYIEFRKFED